MRLKVFWTTLVRRWYLVLAVVLVSGVATFAIVDRVGPVYQTVGAVLLFPPAATVQRNGQTQTAGNPYLQLGGLSQVRDIVLRNLMSQSARDELCTSRGDSAYEAMRSQLCASQPKVTYLASPDFTNGAPIVLITVEADTAANSVTALDAVMDLVPGALEQLQAEFDLRPDAIITSVPLVAERYPEAQHKDQLRAGILTGAVVLAVGLILIGLFDGLGVARRRIEPVGRRAQLVADDDEETAAQPRPVAAPARPAAVVETSDPIAEVTSGRSSPG